MKYIFFFALIFGAIGAQAQCTDTTYTSVIGGKFFKITQTKCDDGTESYLQTPFLDTVSAVNAIVAQIESKGLEIQRAGAIAYKLRQFTNEALKLDTLTTAQFGYSPLTALMAVYEKEFLVGSWVIIYNGTTTPVTFPRLSTNKRIRLRPSGGTDKTFFCIAGNVRIVNYPISSSLNLLVQIKDGYYTTLDQDPTRRIILRRL